MRPLRMMAASLAVGGLVLGVGSAGHGRIWGQRSGLQAQQTGPQVGAPPQATPGGSLGLPPLVPESAGGNRPGHLEEQQAKLRNDERQRKLVADTEKLLALANELKVDVDKTDKNTMSIDVIRKAEEIEKLAHSVKERMKG